MRVIFKQTGQSGTIPDNKFDPKLFSQISPTTGASAPASSTPSSWGGKIGGGTIGNILDLLTGGIQSGVQQSQQAMQATAPKNLGEAINPLHALFSFGSAMAPLAKPAAEIAATKEIGGSIISKTPEILASLPFVGSKLTSLMLGKSGQDIEDLTQLSNANYPAGQLRNTLESAASKFRDNPKLEAILQDEIKTATTKSLPPEDPLSMIGEGRVADENVNISKLQNLKEIAEMKAKYDKVPTPENNLWKAIARGYSDTTKEIQPGLEDALNTYSKWKKIAEDSGDFVKVGKKWIDYGLRFATVRALWSGLKGSSAKPTIKKIK